MSEVIRTDRNAGLELIREHLRKLYEEFLCSYRTVVDTNFPTLQKAFPLRAAMPIRLYLEVVLTGFESSSQINGNLVRVFQKLPKASNNEVILCAPSELEIVDFRAAYYKDQLISRDFTISFDLGRKMYRMGDQLLTNMVYAQIANEWPVVAEYFRKEMGIKRKSTPKTSSEVKFFD